MFFILTEMILLDLATEKVVPVVQPYASLEVAMTVSWSGIAPEGVFPSMQDNNKQRNIIQKFPVADDIVQQAFAVE